MEQFLAQTPHSPLTVLGVLPQEGRQATVLSLAIHDVMACGWAEYMPVLVAAVEAIANPGFRVEDAGSTPSWEPLVVVHGPIARRLALNCGQVVMKVGQQASTSIGRFLRLYMRNICGLRIAPGEGDRGSVGFTFNVALAEDEDAARRLGWPTLGGDLGLPADESAVSVVGIVAISPPLYSAGGDALSHARQFAEVLPCTCALGLRGPAHGILDTR